MLHRIWQGVQLQEPLVFWVKIVTFKSRAPANQYVLQTLAYLLPVLSKAIQNAEKEFLELQQQGKAHEAGTLQALVVVPSRELAMQIVRVAKGLLPDNARATIQQCIGGANPNRQVVEQYTFDLLKPDDIPCPYMLCSWCGHDSFCGNRNISSSMCYTCSGRPLSLTWALFVTS